MKKAHRQKVTWRPMIEYASGASAPDSFEGHAGVIPPDDFVVARDRAGNPVSRYGDPIWDLTAYNPRGKSSRLAFLPWGHHSMTKGQALLVAEIKRLFFILVWKRRGNPLAVTTILVFKSALNEIARFAHQQKCQMADVLGSADLMKQFIHWTSPKVLGSLGSILTTLIELGEFELGFRPVGGATLTTINVALRKYKESLKQYPPIPPRIYSTLIQNVLGQLNEIDSVLDRILRVTNTLCEWKTTTPTVARKNASGRSYASAIQMKAVANQLLLQNDLDGYFLKHDYLLDHHGLMRAITDIYETSQFCIHIFSGARRDEILYLPYDCVEERHHPGGVDYLLHGWTTKFNNGRLKPAQWVTSKEGVYAVSIAQRVAKIIFRLNSTVLDKKGRSDRYPLFVSTRYLPVSNMWRTTKDDRFSALRLRKSTDSDKLLSRLVPIIEERDIDDLKLIDPHRAWFSEPQFKPGNRWPLTRHQLRRSLALYASSSGLVTLPSLRRQLQHLTEAMTRYYAKGSQLSRDLIGDTEGHFGLEYQESQSEAQALAYIASVIFSDDPLFGGHGLFVDQHRMRKKGMISFEDRSQLMKRFKKGEIAWQETMLGGCTKSEPCDKRALRSMIGCLDCKQSVIKLSKLRLVVAAQKALVADLDPTTGDYHAEKHDLDILIAKQVRLEEQTSMRKC